MKNRTLSLAAAAAALLAVTLPAAGASTNVSAADQAFMQQAYSGGLAEIAMGKIAQQKASRSQTKLFGQRMIDDHTQNTTQLAQLAQSQGVTLDRKLPADAESEMKKLSGLSGAAWDQEYLNYEVQDHKKDIGDYKTAEGKTTDPQLKAYIAQSLPTLDAHEQLAETDASLVNK